MKSTEQNTGYGRQSNPVTPIYNVQTAAPAILDTRDIVEHKWYPQCRRT